jgi:broad specificity phosphatase PhoE
VTRLLLLRHGESVHNAHSGTDSLSDEVGDRLTETGVAQAQAAAAWLRDRGVTRLLTSPMRRAAETAAELSDALGLEPEEVPHAHELGVERFEDAIARVHRLKRDVEEAEENLPLLVTHGIFIRFFLLDSVLADAFQPEMAARIWHLRSHNCGLSSFEPSGARDPTGAETPGWSCVSWMERPWDPP